MPILSTMNISLTTDQNYRTMYTKYSSIRDKKLIKTTNLGLIDSASQQVLFQQSLTM